MKISSLSHPHGPWNRSTRRSCRLCRALRPPNRHDGSLAYSKAYGTFGARVSHWLTVPGTIRSPPRGAAFLFWLVFDAHGLSTLSITSAVATCAKFFLTFSDTKKSAMVAYYHSAQKNFTAGGEYNPLQKMAYIQCLRAFDAVVLLSGMAMSPS